MKAATVMPPIMLQAALEIVAKEGWPIFPCKPQNKRPFTLHGFKDASKDFKQTKAGGLRGPTR